VWRPSLVPVIALVSATLGAFGALAFAHALGWVGESKTETLVVPRPQVRDSAAEPAARDLGAKPLLGNGFDPARIYAARSAGVVTIFAEFRGEARSQGSGFVVSREGVILTNSHVITAVTNPNDPDQQPIAAERVYVEFADRDRVPATVVGWDVFDDVGVIRVAPKHHRLDPVPLGSSAGVHVGDPVAIIGSPFGIENSLAVGVVAATRRSVDSLTSSYNLLDAIQTDAPINHGNSGGPMFDSRGRVVGIAAQIRSASGNAEGVGFAVPIDSARRSMRELLRDGKVRYAYVGIKSENLTPSVARRFGFPVERGAIVGFVEPGSPADAAGFRAALREEELNGVPVALGGDVIVAIEGIRVTSADDLVRIVTSSLEPGQVATFTVWRGERQKTIAVRLGDRPTRRAPR
jgi:2-alkenal reductase